MIKFRNTKMDSNNSENITQPEGIVVEELVIKPMEKADSEFAASMLIEAFRPKVEHSVAKDKIPLLCDGFHNEVKTRPEEGYNDIFIAWYGEERAGFLQLMYHDSKTSMGEESYPGIGYCAMIRLGICQYIFKENVKRENCYLDTIAVHSKFRGKGIGKALLMKADQEAIAHGCKMIYLKVVYGNPAIQLYERSGYKIEESKTSWLLNWAVGCQGIHRMEKPLQ